MANNNSPRRPRQNQVAGNNNNYIESLDFLNQLNPEELAVLYRPPISFNCITDNRRPNFLPPPRSSSIILRLPRVPFIVNRRLVHGGPITAVTCGVAPLNLCEDYADFMVVLAEAFLSCVGERLEDIPTLDVPIPGYDLWYEMMGPVRRNVRFRSHPWGVFKARVRVLVLEKRAVND